MLRPKQKPYLTYALDAEGKLIHVDSVSTGLACKCFCPHCKSELVAKNGGNRKVHHFAHANGSDCVGAIESALHKMAKDILQEHRLIMLPPVQQGGIGKQMAFGKIEVEVFAKELSLRPDCIGYTEDGFICKVSQEALDCLETQNLAVALIWESSLDFTLAGEDGCISNYDMYTPIYSYKTDKLYLIPYSIAEDWKRGEIIEICNGREPTKEELEYIKDFNN